MRPTRGRLTAARCFLFAAGLALCLVYGHRGYLGLDQSIIFDGGWRVLSRQIPERDFFTPAGIVPSVMQAAVFAALGVTWFAYCLHAALLNGLFAVIVFELLRTFNAPSLLAAFYAGLSAIYFYTPFGVPYPDQHAFFFSVAMVAATRAAYGRSGRSQTAWLTAVPLLGACALLSKPIPSLLLIIGVGLWLTYDALRGRWRPLAVVTAASTATVALAAAAIVSFGIDLSQLRYFVYELPSHEMRWRLHNLSTWSGITARSGRILGEIPHLWLWVVAAAGVTVILTGLTPRGRREARAATTPLLLALAGVAITVLFDDLTNNSPMEGLALVALVAGLSHMAILTCLRGLSTTAAIRQRASIGIAFAVVGAMVIESAVFQTTVNAHRTVHDNYWSDRAASVPVPPPLAYLRLNARWEGRDLPEILAALQRTSGNFLLIGDDSVLYGATHRPSVFPVLWMHADLTMPSPQSPDYPAFEDRLLASVRRHHVRFVVQQQPWTWTGISLATFPRLAQQTAGCASSSVARWMLIDICHPAE